MVIKKRTICVLLVLILFLLFYLIFKRFYKKFDINQKITYYDLETDRYSYIEYIKKDVYPQALRSFVYNDYITFSQYSDDATGNDLKDQIEFKAYELLFSSLFDKDRTNYDDCPVTEKFKEKFKTNLFDYYNLSKSEDCQKICSLYRQEKEIKVEVFGNFKNTEPTYWTTHHFKYTLDKDGNVDDVAFDYTE